jgi:hypothetical protein
VTAQGELPEAAGRLTRSLARLAESTAQYARARVDAAERRMLAERRRGVAMAVSAGLLFVWLGVGSLFFGFAIVTAFQETNRVLGAAVAGGSFLVLAAGAGWTLWLLSCRRNRAADWIAQLALLFAAYRRWSR